MMKESSMTSKSSRRSRRHRFSDQSGGILAVLPNNSPSVPKQAAAVKKEPPTTLPVKKKQAAPPPSRGATAATAATTTTTSTPSSVPPTVIFTQRQLNRDKQQKHNNGDDDDDDDAVSELTSDLEASLRSTKTTSSSKNLTSTASPIPEQDEEEETESEGGEEYDEEEDCSSSEVESTTESSDGEEGSSSESDEEGDRSYKIKAWKGKEKVKVVDATSEEEDDVDDDSEMEYDNDDEYDPNGDNTESEEEDDEDDSSEELELDEDDIRVTQKARRTNGASSSGSLKMDAKKKSPPDENEESSDDESDQSLNDKSHLSANSGKCMVPYEDTTDDEDDNESKGNEKNTSRASDGGMSTNGSVVCESQMQDSDDESIAVAHIIDESLAKDDESVLEVEVESNERDEDDMGFPEEDQPTPHEDEPSENGTLTDLAESSFKNQTSTERCDKEDVVESSATVDENRLVFTSKEEPAAKVGNTCAQSTDETSQSERLSECDDDFIAETASINEEDDVRVERTMEDVPRQNDANLSTIQQSPGLVVVSTENVEVPPLAIGAARPINTTEKLSASLGANAQDRIINIPAKLNRDEETASASKQSADILAQVKLAENGAPSEQKINIDASLGQAMRVPIQAGQKPFPRTRSEGSIKQGQWTLGSRIGTGSFGVVHMGMNHRNGSLMAVKSIPMQPAIMSDIRREIELLKFLNHTNVVTYYGAEINASGLHIFQEWVAGGSVSDLLSKFGPLPFPVIQSYAEQTLKGLAYLHANNILHRDIKGSNLLVSDEGIVKLADFGGSRKLAELNADMMMSMTLRGTPYFMAPEVFEQRYSSKADIWSVGCVMYEMVTATAPWKHIGFNNPFKLCRHLQNTEGPPQLPRTLPAADGNVLNNFLSAMAQCFHRTPFERPCSVVLLQHPFFTERGYFSDDEYSDSPGLFSPEVIRTQARRLASPSRAFRTSPRPAASPVRNHPMRTPPRPQNKSAASVKSPFLSPPLPTRREKPDSSPKPYTPGKDTSGWPEWAKKKYERDQRTSASPMLDSLAFSSDSSVRPPSDSLQNTVSESCLQGLQFLSLTDPESSHAPNKDI